MAKETVQVHLSLKLRLLCMPSICDLQFEKKKKKKKRKIKQGKQKNFTRKQPVTFTFTRKQALSSPGVY